MDHSCAPAAGDSIEWRINTRDRRGEENAVPGGEKSSVMVSEEGLWDVNVGLCVKSIRYIVWCEWSQWTVCICIFCISCLSVHDVEYVMSLTSVLCGTL